MIPNLLAPLAVVAIPAATFAYVRWMNPTPLIADDPYDEQTGLDRMEKYGPARRLK